MKSLNWDTFEKKIYIRTTVDRLYRLWATEDGITQWFLNHAEYTDANGVRRPPNDLIQKGDRFVWRWHNWDGKEEGQVLDANGKDFLQFTFAEGKLDISFKQQNDIVIVELKQFEIPQDEENKLKTYWGCSNGWTFWLTNLKAYIEHGILLNETEVDFTDNQLAGWIFVNM